MANMTPDALALLLKTDIRNRKYLSGDKLPSEGNLSRTHHVSVRMVREALAQLVGQGLVYKVKAYGTYVK